MQCCHQLKIMWNQKPWESRPEENAKDKDRSKETCSRLLFVTGGKDGCKQRSWHLTLQIGWKLPWPLTTYPLSLMPCLLDLAGNWCFSCHATLCLMITDGFFCTFSKKWHKKDFFWLSRCHWVRETFSSHTQEGTMIKSIFFADSWKCPVVAVSEHFSALDKWSCRDM